MKLYGYTVIDAESDTEEGCKSKILAQIIDLWEDDFEFSKGAPITTEVIAQVFTKAVKLHEDSYATTLANVPCSHYAKSQEQCFEEVVKDLDLDPRLARFFYLAFHWGNDILGWCEEITNPTKR